MAQQHPFFARIYRWLSPVIEHSGIGRRRQRLLSDLVGEVLELGAGTGVNFARYPESVVHVIALEPEPYLRRVAAAAARRARRPIDIRDGRAEAIPLPDASVDVVVATLVLCSVSKLDRTLHEIRRVLRSGGELRLLEHGRAPSRLMLGFQRALDATVWPYVAGGCHLARDLRRALLDAGFKLVEPEHQRTGRRQFNGIWIHGSARAD